MGVKTTPGNVHDSKVFKELYDDVKEKFPVEIEGVAVDSAYKSGKICNYIMKHKHNPYMPYKRTNENKNYFRKYEFFYDDYLDSILCPNGKELKYKRATKEGKLIFEANPWDCDNCPLRDKCFNSKKYNRKKVQLDIYHKALELTNHLRYTLKGRAIYQNRSMTVERRFGDMKVKHNGRFTYLRGIDNVSDDLLLLFTTMNIKKAARRLSFLQG